MWDVVSWGFVALATSLGQPLAPFPVFPCLASSDLAPHTPVCTLLSCKPHIPPTAWSCSPLSVLEAQSEADVVTRLTSERMG